MRNEQEPFWTMPYLDDEKPPDLDITEASYEDLHFDEVPILWTGLNSDGQRILASSVAVYWSKQFSRDFAMVVPSDLFDKFRHQQISYPEVMRVVEIVHIIDRDHKTGDRKYSYHHVTDIPEEVMPREQALCPVAA